MIDAPCKDCERKGCGAYHDECPGYQEYKAQMDEIRHKQTLDCAHNARGHRAKVVRPLDNGITRQRKYRVREDE